MGIFSMPRNGANIRTVNRFAALIAVLALSGCSYVSPQIEPVDEPEVVEVPTKVEPPKVEPPKVAEPPQLPPVAIVVTSSRPAFLDVANALTSHLDDFQIYDLSDDSEPPVSVLRRINDSNTGTVVAIGLRAAKSSVAMAESPVVFSQVFNHQDYGLLTENSRGVAPLPPLDAQLAAWTKIDPTLSVVGIIVGEGHDDPTGHMLEAQLLEAAYEAYGTAESADVTARPVALSLEFFQRDAQPILDEYLAGLITERSFRAASRPWPRSTRTAARLRPGCWVC